MKKSLCVFFCLFLNAALYSQINTDTLFTLKGVPVSFTIDAEGFVLSHVTEYQDPFYHASGMFSSVVTAKIGKNVRVPLRIVAENWNFSEKYGSDKNLWFWVKPSIQARIIRLPILDSVVFNVGDLWRQKQGQGLILDYFEYQGGEVKFYKNKLEIAVRDMGYGLTGSDDIATFSVGYDSAISIRHFMNYFNFGNSSKDVNISSIDSYVKISRNIHIYQEAALNLSSFAKGANLGLVILYGWKKNFVDTKIEFRYYEKDFYFENTSVTNYFESMTALDKPLNNYYVYLINNQLNRVLSARVRARWFPIDGFFADVDLEPMIGDIEKFGYEAAIGFEPESNVFLRAGIMNKFFNRRYEYYEGFDSRVDIPQDNGFFRLGKKPFLFAKASFKI